MCSLTTTFDPLSLIEQYYPVGSDGYNVLVTHSKNVTEWALEIAENRPDLSIDKAFVYEAAMLHDIGIFLTNAPSIYCFGSEPYIRHGILGAKILRDNNLPKHAFVAERHTASGLTHDEIVAENLPLPLDRSYMPETIEEKLICYADCFYSKTHLNKKKTVEGIYEKMVRQWSRFGFSGPPLNAIRFMELHQLFFFS